MGSIYINDLKLPSLLIEMIEAKRWHLPENTENLSNLTEVRRPTDFNFLSPDGMKRETESARMLALDQKLSSIYNLYSSKAQTGHQKDPDSLDIDLAILIAVNWDEEAIFLDYRRNLEEPSVILAYWPEDKSPATHRLLAKDFASFVAEIGL